MRRGKTDRERAEALLGESDAGLEALLSGAGIAEAEAAEPEARAGRQLQMVAVDALEPSPFQPRLEMGEEDLRELAASLEQAGVLEPLLVRPCPRGRRATGKGRGVAPAERYEIVAGERRWRAAQLAGLTEVPCLVSNVDDTQARVIALMENLHRRDLSDYERGRALRDIKVALGLSWTEVGERVGLSKRSVQRLVQFAELPEEVEEEVGEGAGVKHYAALALLHGRPEEQRQLARLIREKGLTGSQAGRAAQALVRGEATKPQEAVRQALDTAEPAASGNEAAAVLRELMRLDGEVRRLAEAGLSASQRQALADALEGLCERFRGIVEKLRGEERE